MADNTQPDQGEVAQRHRTLAGELREMARHPTIPLLHKADLLAAAQQMESFAEKCEAVVVGELGEVPET